MLQTTYDAVKSVLRADPSITVAERNEKLHAIRAGPAKQPPGASAPPKPRLLRRAQAAEILACSVRTVDKIAKQGLLKKIRLPARQRAAGFLESDVLALLNQ